MRYTAWTAFWCHSARRDLSCAYNSPFGTREVTSTSASQSRYTRACCCGVPSGPARAHVPVDLIAHVAQIDDVALVHRRAECRILVRFRVIEQNSVQTTPQPPRPSCRESAPDARALRAVTGAVDVCQKRLRLVFGRRDRLEENVVLWISCHQTDLSGNGLQAMGARADSVPPDRRRVHCRPLLTQRNAARSSHG